MSNIPTRASDWHIGLIGYGEVGRILAEDLRAQGITVSAYDRKLEGSEAASLQAHTHQHGVSLKGSHAEVAQVADLVISAVTASQTVTVAQAAAPGIQPDAFFLDFNSASPGAKQDRKSVV